MKELDKTKNNTDLTAKQKEIIARIRERSKDIIKGEFLKIPFLCSKNGKRFVVCLRKNEKRMDESYKVEKIITEDDLSSPDLGSSFSTAGRENGNNDPREAEIDISKIDREKLKCPYCGSDDVIQCSCGALTCGGGVVKEGEDKKFYNCPGCKREGYITGTFQTISGTKAEEKKLLDGQRRKSLDNKIGGMLNAGD